MIASAVLLVRVPQPPQAGSGAAEATQNSKKPRPVLEHRNGAVRTIHLCEGVRSYEQRPYQQRGHCDLRDSRHVGQAGQGPARTRQERQGEQMIAAAPSPTRVCAFWCLSGHAPEEPCFSGYDSVPFTLHEVVAVITRDGVSRVPDELRTSVEQAPGQPARVVVSHGEASVELTAHEALAHALQVAGRALAALQTEVAS